MLIRTIATALAVTALALQSTSVQASEGPKVLVIADTGFDTQLPLLQDRIIHEACILDWYLCPNGTNFQEGPETASLPLRISQIGGFGHGTQMASVAALTDANVKFILIRIIAYSSNGTRLPAQDSSVVRLLDWVLANKDKFNIGAVAMAQGHHSLLSTRDYCPKTPAVEKRIIELKRADIPFVLPTGNKADKEKIDWPACIPSALAIGASNDKDEIAKFSNIDRNLVDFYTPGYSDSFLPGGRAARASGTSVSTLIAATRWVAQSNHDPSASYSQTYQYFRGGPIIFDELFNYGRLMFRQLGASP